MVLILEMNIIIIIIIIVICHRPPHPSDTQTLLGFHLSLPMGSVDSAPYYCCTRKIVSSIANAIWGVCSAVMPHPLEYVAEISPGVATNK